PQATERQRAGHCAGRDSHGSGGAPPFRGRAYLRYLRRRDGGDWERGAPEPEDGTGPVLDPGGCVLYLRLQAVRSGNRRRQSPENTQAADALPGQLCLPGGGGPYHDAEICYALAAVPPGAGVSAAEAEAVPADDGQLDPAGLGHLAAACV